MNFVEYSPAPPGPRPESLDLHTGTKWGTEGSFVSACWIQTTDHRIHTMITKDALEFCKQIDDVSILLNELLACGDKSSSLCHELAGQGGVSFFASASGSDELRGLCFEL